MTKNGKTYPQYYWVGDGYNKVFRILENGDVEVFDKYWKDDSNWILQGCFANINDEWFEAITEKEARMLMSGKIKHPSEADPNRVVRGFW